MIDRHSRFTKLEKVFSRNSDEVNHATAAHLSGEAITITNDDGVEFGGFQRLENYLHVRAMRKFITVELIQAGKEEQLKIRMDFFVNFFRST